MGIISETIPQDVMEKLGRLAESSKNQPEKADKIEKWFKSLGFKPLDMGTNRVVYTHKKYPKVVFKISLDEQGILDNLNEYQKSDMSPYFPESFDIDEQGYVLVQKRCPTLSLEEFNDKETRKRIRRMLEELSKDFILIDVGSDKHKNFGKDKHGNLYVIDFGYVEIKSLGNFNCPHTRYISEDKVKYCKGTLHYTKDFKFLRCDKCDNIFKPDVVLEGYTATRYEDIEKSSWYTPSDELREFYMNFTKTRDRSTLTKYVELSHNKQKTAEKGEGRVSTYKEKFLKKLGGRQQTESPPVVYEEVDDDDSPAQEAEEEQPKQHPKQLRMVGGPKISRPVYHSTPDGIDILKRNDELESVEEIDENDKLYRYRSLARELLKPNLTEETAAAILSKAFYEVFPEAEKLIGALKDNLEKTVDSIYEESGIEIIKPASSENEIHIAFSVENLKKQPWIVMSKGDTIVHINLAEHMERIYQIDHDEETDLIATVIHVEPLTTFDGDYDSKYFEESDEDEKDDD